MGKVIKQFQFYSFVVISLVDLRIMAMRPPEQIKISENLSRGPNISTLNINIDNRQRLINKGIENVIMIFGKISSIPVRRYSGLFASYIVSYISNNRCQIAGISLAALYLYLFSKVIKGNKYLGRKDSWALWKCDCSLVQLLEIPQKQLSQELLLEIQRRYTSIEKPIDFISSLIAFMHNIDQEIAYTKYFISLEAWLRAFRISLFFPINRKRFSQAPDNLNRLIYIRNLFLTWAAHYKIDQNKRIPLTMNLTKG